MHISVSTAPAILIAISALQASASYLPGVFGDVSSLYHRQHRRSDCRIRQYASAIANHGLYRAHSIPTITAVAPSTIVPASSSHGASAFDPAILNHELYRAGAVVQPTITSHNAVSAIPQFDDVQKVNPITWNMQTKAACETALRKLEGKASNPSGMAVCYNLPVLNKSTGVFQADMRLYRVSAPATGWGKMENQAIGVGLYFPGATVASQTISKRNRASHASSWQPIEDLAAIELDRRADDPNAPQMLQAFKLVGQINDNMMGEVANRTALESLVLPQITLSAMSTAKGAVNTTLSMADASFVNGIFADQAGTTASGGMPAFTSAVSGKQIAFVMPGTTLGIFPVGLIITGSWAVAFMAVVGYGTVGRMRFREQYRRRVRREVARSVKTI